MFERLQQYYRAGRAIAFSSPRSNKTIAFQFERHAAGAAADVPFLLYRDERYTYKAANAEVNRYANAYKALGIGKGDTVALLFDNRPAFLWHYLAAGKIGAIASLINTHNTGEPLLHALRICSPKLIVVGSEHMAAFDEVRYEFGAEIRSFVDVDPEKPVDPDLHLRAWSEATAGASDANPPETSTHTLEDMAAYIYTSGTTGLPKAAHVRNLRLYLFGQMLGSLGWGLKRGDVLYSCLPLYHSNGIGVCTGAVISNGVTMALARRFSASRFWNDIRRYDATGFIYIGELCRYLYNQPARPDDRQHRVRAICGNGLRADIWAGFTQRFGIERVAEFYGSTEGNIGTLNLDETVGSVGRLLFGGVLVRWDESSDAFVRGPDGFLVKCKANEPGVLLGRITKSARFDGYHDKDATQKKIVHDAFKKGDAWFNTGDLLRMDEKRRLFFVDRMGDTFRWKGENVSTFEVQEQVSSWPPATEANAYGVQIPGAEGRAGMVAVVLDGEFDGRSFRKHVDSSLPPYARPLFVRVRESMEITGTFKLKKGNLSAEGFDPNALQDPIFFRDPAQDSYVPLTTELYEQLQSGKLKL
jgi:acyl-CoA synthetase (AMP-forming)/AMP-acid ligase II